MALPLPGGIQLRCFYVCLVAFVVGLIWWLVTGFVIWKPIVLVVWCVRPVVWIVSALSVSLSSTSLHGHSFEIWNFNDQLNENVSIGLNFAFNLVKRTICRNVGH